MRQLSGLIQKLNPGENFVKPNLEMIKIRIFEYLKIIQTNQKLNQDDCDGGPYVGVAGIAYALTYLSSQIQLFDSKDIQNFEKEASKYLFAALSFANKHEKDNRSSLAFLLGFAGVYVIAVIFFHQTNDKTNRDLYLAKFLKLAPKVFPENYLPKGSDELLVGRAGYICGANLINRCLGQKVISEETLLRIGYSSISSGRNYSNKRKLSEIVPLMYAYHGSEYLGAAHGLSGILQALLSIPKVLNPKHGFEADIKKSIDFLLSLQTPSNNFPSSMDEHGVKIRSDERQLVHWCHGAPGVVWLMARAYLIWKEEKYLTSCLKCGDLIWEKGLLKKGPGICHGVAGNAYVFLLLYRLTNDIKHLHRANQFQEFLFTQEFLTQARTPDSPYSLFEGLSGTVCFLADLMQPEKATFPLFFDIFEDVSILN